MEDVFVAISNAIYDGDCDLVGELVNQALDGGANPEDIISKGGIDGLERLGQAFNDMEAFLPELMLGGDAMHTLLSIVRPYLEKGGTAEIATVILGCAQGDLHDIGMNLVATQLTIGGFNVINLGSDITAAEFISAAKQHNAKIIGVSSLLTTSSYYQQELVKKMNKEGLHADIKVIVGGGPITANWTRQIGADGYARTANQAIDVCRGLVKGGESLPIIIE